MLTCPDSVANFLGVFDLTIAPTLLYYSYIPTAILAIFFASLMLWRKNIPATRAFFLVALTYTVYHLNELILWIGVPVKLVMFSWQMSTLLYCLLVVAIFYFNFILVYGHETGKKTKIAIFLSLLPVVLLLPTVYNIESFDLENCEGLLAELGYYIYFISIAYLVLTVWTGIIAIREHVNSGLSKRQIIFGSAATVSMLVFAVFTNLFGSITGEYTAERIAPVGFVVFTAAVSYLIVRYNIFNIRILSAQILISALVFLNFAMLFIRSINNVKVILVITLVITLLIGRSLIKSVKNEILQREKIQILAKDLEKVNEQQTNLMHFITHQIKGFFTKSRNIFAMALEGDFGTAPASMTNILKQGLDSDARGVELVQELLNATNIKRGTVQYNMVPTDMRTIVSEAFEMIKLQAEAKGLTYTLELAEEPVVVKCDAAFIRQAVRNFIDNSVKYTPQGFIKVEVLSENGKAIVRVSDSGVGLTKEDMSKLFTEGGRGSESRKMNVESTGYGLYIVKNIIEHHGGKVHAMSAGSGKGSTFEIQLPLAA